MDAKKLKYPYGKCSSCGGEFNADLRCKYNITHCPWCGKEIDDFLSSKNEERENDIYCEECGTRIYERYGKNNEGGGWIDNEAGVCSGPCERELCGNCADWDVNGECEQCRNSPCGRCPNHAVVEMCQKCEHLTEREKWADYEVVMSIQMTTIEAVLNCLKK